MKFMTLTIFLSIICMTCLAPEWGALPVMQPEPIKQDFILAFMEVESGFRADAMGKLDDVGILQQRPI